MSDILTPHFDLPFRLEGDSFAVAEQDSIDDVTNCVVAIVSTTVGWRDEAPSFGLADPTLSRLPIGANVISEEIASQEPRALLIVEERPDIADELIDRINIGVSTTRQGSS